MLAVLPAFNVLIFHHRSYFFTFVCSCIMLQLTWTCAYFPHQLTLFYQSQALRKKCCIAYSVVTCNLYMNTFHWAVLCAALPWWHYAETEEEGKWGFGECQTPALPEQQWELGAGGERPSQEERHQVSHTVRGGHHGATRHPGTWEQPALQYYIAFDQAESFIPKRLSHYRIFVTFFGVMWHWVTYSSAHQPLATGKGGIGTSNHVVIKPTH